MNDLVVYNHSNTPNPYIFRKCQDSLISAFEDNPPNEMFWYPAIIFTKSHVVFAIANFFFHYIPALQADGIIIIAGMTPRVNYQDYVRTTNYGVRYFACKEEDKDLPKARKNFRRLKMYYIVSWGLFVLFVLGIIGLILWLSVPKELYLS
ncbi:unnamed protein product [Allacma fusca]|uniref:Uncharacterized protein n=1 Tax=Allacma fusca TaxID=39272 RepID=A0A8J2KR59_9HEXA|nr:unnamed protein product [Allacma fusca]